MSSFHEVLGFVAAGINGIVGLWGIVLSRRETIPKTFYWAVGIAIITLLAQVVLGVVLMSVTDIDPGDQHTFYGVVIAVTFAFAYIYRAEFRKRPALAVGLLLLFAMGLGLRAIMTFGMDF